MATYLSISKSAENPVSPAAAPLFRKRRLLAIAWTALVLAMVVGVSGLIASSVLGA
jgi:hypothetical protein